MAALTQVERDQAEYAEYLDRAKREDLSDVDSLNIIYRSGVDQMGRPIIVFVSSHLPAKQVDMERVLLYLISILDPVVETDYVLVYVHTNMSSENRPAFQWLRRVYKIFNRKYKKNLKALYIVHPTVWVKVTLRLFKPFISSKFWRKLVYIEDVHKLFEYIDRNQITLPEAVLKFRSRKQKAPRVFGVALDELESTHLSAAGIPTVCEHAIEVLLSGPRLEGLFRISGSASQIAELRRRYDEGEEVDLRGIDDPHVVAGVLKLFLKELPEPLFPYAVYPRLIQSLGTGGKSAELKQIIGELPVRHKQLLHRLLQLLVLLQAHADVTRMDAANLAIVFSPNLIRAPNETMAEVIHHTPVRNAIVRELIDGYNFYFEQ